MPELDKIISQVQLLRLEPGDTLLVRVGLSAEEMGEGGPWIPSMDELERVESNLKRMLPEDVEFIVTPLGIRFSVVREEKS